MTTKFSLGFLALFASSVLSTPATATTISILLPVDAITSAVMEISGKGVMNEGVAPQASVFTDGYGDKAVAVASVGQAVSMSAVGNAGGEALMQYSFEVAGSNNIASVPVFATGQLFASSPTFADAYATIEGVPYSYNVCSPNCISGSMNFKTPMLSLKPNTPYAVTLGALAENDSLIVPANAVADPYFQIDPAFLKANPGYSLEFSAGITNQPVSAVPLPASFPLFATGLLALMGFAAVKRVRQGC